MSITVDILTPDRRVLQAQADSVVVPAADGELGILSDHAPLVAQLQPGEIRMRTGIETKFLPCRVDLWRFRIIMSSCWLRRPRWRMRSTPNAPDNPPSAPKPPSALPHRMSTWRRPKRLFTEPWRVCARWKPPADAAVKRRANVFPPALLSP